MWRASGLPTTVTDKLLASGLEQAFGDALARHDASVPLALAVSGGGDSVALMHLAAHWAQTSGIAPATISILTVDHGLRPESGVEAAQVGTLAKALGFPHHVLFWQGAKPTSRVQERARAARRELMCGWCRQNGICDLLMAHTVDDQLETVGMRLLRGGGTAGLGGMRANADGPFGVRILRPLLGASRAELRGWLQERGLSWIDDPSNDDAAFERVRMRRALAVGPVDGLADIASRAGATRDALEGAADALLRDAVTLYAAGWARIELGDWQAAPDAVAAHALARLLVALGGRDHPPRRESLARLQGALTSPDFTGATLAGCRISPESRKSVTIGREVRNLSARPLTARQWALWDHRFEIWSPAEATVRPLAGVGLDAFEGQMRERVKAAAPAAFRGALPVVDFGGGALAVPHAGVSAGIEGGEALEAVFTGLRPFDRIRATDAAKKL